MFLNCGVGEDSWEPLARDQISQSQRKSVLNIHWKHWCWSWSSSTLATWCKNWLIGKELDSEKVWSQEEKGMTENEMVRWHFWLDGHEFVQSHGLQHARPPCPSPTPEAYSNPCPSSWWCHPTISSSVVPFSSRLQSITESESFPISQFFT